jgi:hypothetical protein
MKWRILSILVALAVLLSLSLVTAVPTQAATAAQIENSIVTGLEWLASVQQPSGSWQFWQESDDPQYDVGTTGLAVLKFEDRAKNLGLEPFDTVNYQYANNITNGLNYIFSNAVQDANGVHFPAPSPSDSYWPDVYNTGIAMMAVSASNHPGSVVAGGALAGMTYLQVVQEMMNWMAFAQNGGADIYTGGWPYSLGPPQPWGDNSISGYATIGIGFAHAAPPDGFGVGIPASVLTGLTTWTNTVQISGGLYDGGSLYNPAGTYYINTLKTGNLLYELALTNVPFGNSRVTRAINFISTYWGANGGESNGDGWLGDYQAMFCMMKGLQAYGITAIPGHPDWFDEVSTYIVANQSPDGHWLSTTGEVTGSATISTAFALLTLEKVAPPPMPTLDHFKCYQVEGGQSLGTDVYLKDQFGTFRATVKDAELFCNPVEKLHGNVTTPILNPDHHLTVYTIDCKEKSKIWQVEVDNQFGSQNLTVQGPVALAVPTWKLYPGNHTEPIGLDHYLLYKVILAAPMEVVVDLNDQFGDEPGVVLTAPVYFANPVLKVPYVQYGSGGEAAEVPGLVYPEVHLVFYPEIVANEVVVIKNQFVDNDWLNVIGCHLLAVPSEKISFEGPCFIATAAYGSPMAEEIQILREFRDEYLLTNAVGRALVGVYYRVSPPMAEFITEHPSLKPIVRAGLAPALAMSAVAVNTTPAEKAAIIGLVVLVSVALTVWARRRRGRGSEYG